MAVCGYFLLGGTAIRVRERMPQLQTATKANRQRPGRSTLLPKEDPLPPSSGVQAAVIQSTWSTPGCFMNYTVKEKGDKGDPGPLGSKGSRGLQGQPGFQGRKGSIGDKGEHGELGERGEPGRPGPPGPLGQQGLEGRKGATGDRGHPGCMGPKVSARVTLYALSCAWCMREVQFSADQAYILGRAWRKYNNISNTRHERRPSDQGRKRFQWI
jgi:hypothetical protein